MDSLWPEEALKDRELGDGWSLQFTYDEGAVVTLTHEGSHFYVKAYGSDNTRSKASAMENLALGIERLMVDINGESLE